MLTELNHLTDIQKADLDLFVEKITKAVAVNKIICYGIRTYDSWNWSALPVSQEQYSPNHIAIDLLVVPDKEEKRHNAEILQWIEKMASPRLKCTCVVRAINVIHKALADRHLFYSRVFSQGIFLFGSREEEPGIALFDPSAHDYLSKAAGVWEHHSRQAYRFHSTANWLLEGKYPEQALFYLHQATEQIAMALMHSLTGYRPNSHNIPQLLALLEQFGLHTTSIFPPKDAEAKELFNLLKNSYIDSRYKEEYLVEMEPVETLYDKVKLLIEMAEKVYEQQISAWEQETDRNTDPPNDDGAALSIPLHTNMQQAS